MNKVYNEEHRAFFLEFIPGHTDNEVANEFNRRFDIKITPSKVHTYKQNNRIKSGTKKGCEKTWFKKGHIPHNRVAVGTEVMSSVGYLKIKIADPDVWVFKHIMEWEKHHGSVPENCLISFKDGDRYNCKIENLMCITRAEHSILNFQEMRFSSPELTESALTIAKLKHRIREIQKEQK